MDPHQKLQGAQQGEGRLAVLGIGFRAKTVHSAAAMLQSGVVFLIHRLESVDFGTLQSFSCESLVVLQLHHTLISTHSENCPKKKTLQRATKVIQAVSTTSNDAAEVAGGHTIIRGQHCLTSGPNYQKSKKQQHIRLFLSIIVAHLFCWESHSHMLAAQDV